MPSKVAKNKFLSVKAHAGDVRTRLAFDIPNRKNTTNLGGFTIHCQPLFR
jgi:hypothetical protein